MVQRLRLVVDGVMVVSAMVVGEIAEVVGEIAEVVGKITVVVGRVVASSGQLRPATAYCG